MSTNSKDIVKRDKQFKAFMKQQLQLKETRPINEKVVKEITPSLLDKIYPKNKSVTNELEIQYKRITNIIDKLVARLKIAACYHILVKDDMSIIRECISDDSEFNFVSNILQNTYKIPRSDSMSKIGASSLIEAKQKADFETNKLINEIWEDYFDPSIARCVDIMYRNKELMKIVEELYENADEDVVDFIYYILKIKDITIQKSQVSSIEEMSREKTLKQAYSSNVMLVEHIQELQLQLEKQKEELGAELEKKNAIVQKYIEKVQKTKDEFKENIRTKIHESEKSMTKRSLHSEETQLNLKADAENITNEYNRILEDHINSEKFLRARRLKVEAQLASWIAKYDQDIGELQAQYEKLQKEYDDDKAEMDRIQQLLDDQEEEYLILMAEKDEEETRICEEMALAYLRRRAARIIQRAWRAYWIRKLERKKKKSKGKGEKKEKGAKKRDKMPQKEVKSGGRSADPNAALEAAFKGEAFDEIQNPNAFG